MRKNLAVLCFLALLACSEQEQSIQTVETTPLAENHLTDKNPDGQDPVVIQKKSVSYEILGRKIMQGSASLAEVRQAMTDENIGSLVNTIHAMYSMRWHRGAMNLLDKLWALKLEEYPELNPELFRKTPVRLAMASTINRIKVINTEEYLSYLREHKYDDHEFHRAQVVMALAFNQNPDDVEYLYEMADSENHYVTQTAISALAIMGGNSAKKALGQLWKKYRNTPRGDLIEDVLKHAYNEVPNLAKPEP